LELAIFLSTGPIDGIEIVAFFHEEKKTVLLGFLPSNLTKPCSFGVKTKTPSKRLPGMDRKKAKNEDKNKKMAKERSRMIPHKLSM